MSDSVPPTAAKLGLVAALLLMVASGLVWDIVHRGPRSAAESLPPSDRLLVVTMGGEPPRPTPRRHRIDRTSSRRRQSVTSQRTDSEVRREPERREAAAPPADELRYQVKDGQCLYNIAVEVFGTGARWPEIARRNGLAEPFILREGQILHISR